MFKQLLEETNYDSDKTKFLIEGFKEGFSIGYEGDVKVKLTAPNLPLKNEGDNIIIWNRIMKEVRASRFAGPFTEIPFEFYIQSPISLVPKDGGRDVRLIFHLSHPRLPKACQQRSVNANTPEHLCTVEYPDFSRAVQLCINAGKNCKIAKSDMKSAFRNIWIKRDHWKFLIFKAVNPKDGKTYFFVDKCLRFRASYQL